MIKKKIHESGMSKITLLFLVVIGGSLVYFGSQVINFYYCFYEIEGLMEFQAKKGQVFKDSEIRETIFERVKKLEIPVDDPEEIKINRVDGKLYISMRYSEVLEFDYNGKSHEIYVFPFNPHVAVPYQ